MKTQSIAQAAPKERDPMKFTLDYPPSLNALYATVNGRRVLSKAGRQYKGNAALDAFRQGAYCISGAVVISIDVYRPAKRGDLDNTFKVILDALKGIAWEDDKQIVGINARRFDDKEYPRVEIEVAECES
jgi:crossover junction endodeoxyribonuclease RusA